MSPPENARARLATGRLRETNKDGRRVVLGATSVKSEPLLAFLIHRDYASFRAAFPWLVGDLSFSDFLELCNDSLAEPQSFSEWLAARDDAISPRGGTPQNNKKE